MQYSDLTTAGEMLSETMEAATLTAGSSMRPLFREHKDIVVIKRLDAPLKKGDVVVYPGSNNKYVLHRIIRIKGDTLIIRGDNNFFIEMVPKTQVIGILKEFYRDGKYCNCEKSVTYKLYSWYIRNSYPLRYIWRKGILPFLVKIKHKLFRAK